MDTQPPPPVNVTRRRQAQAALEAVLADALRRGFYGTVAIEVSVQDGTIQRIRRKVEQMQT